MSRLYRLYEASPEAAFAKLEEDLAQLRARLAAVAENAEALRDCLDTALKGLTTPAMIAPAPTRWTYDARLPNPYFDNVFDAEITAGEFKRWVRRSGSLKTRLALPREVQYDFSITVANFAVRECRATLRLIVDGREYPWLSVTENVFSTIILENPEAHGLEFEVCVDTALLPQDRDVSFSFSGIEIVRRQMPENVAGSEAE